MGVIALDPTMLTRDILYLKVKNSGRGARSAQENTEAIFEEPPLHTMGRT